LPVNINLKGYITALCHKLLFEDNINLFMLFENVVLLVSKNKIVEYLKLMFSVWNLDAVNYTLYISHCMVILIEKVVNLANVV